MSHGQPNSVTRLAVPLFGLVGWLAAIWLIRLAVRVTLLLYSAP
jgi:hypothetical protein